MNSNMVKLFSAVAVVVATAAFISMLPDLKRYIKIERM
jgi:hypothetical protein